MLEWSMLLLSVLYVMSCESCESCERPLRFFVTLVGSVMIWFVVSGEYLLL